MEVLFLLDMMLYYICAIYLAAILRNLVFCPQDKFSSK